MTTVDCSALRIQLAEAQNALHKLLTGTQAQTVNFGPSKSATFTAANIDQLRRYIDEMKQQLASCCGEGDATPRAPVRFNY